MSQLLYSGYKKIPDIFERYAMYEFDQKMVNFLVSECGHFLYTKNVPIDAIKYFIVEFEIKNKQSYIGFKGGNLMSTLWMIDIFPPNPEKFIIENTCIFDGKKYIYDPRRKSLKIRKYATTTKRSKSNN